MKDIHPFLKLRIEIETLYLTTAENNLQLACSLPSLWFDGKRPISKGKVTGHSISGDITLAQSSTTQSSSETQSSVCPRSTVAPG